MKQAVREKFTQYGTDSLSDKEIISVLIGRQAEKIKESDLRKLARMDWQDLRYRFDLTTDRAIKVEALFKFSRRIQSAKIGNEVQLASPEDAVAYFGPKLRDLSREVFIVAFLNNAKIIKGYKKISSGGSTATIVDPSEVIRQAIVNKANSILLAHNHPSGNCKESNADIRLTKRIYKSAKLLGIGLDDHIIIAGHSFTSLKTKGIIS
jgi:DNA repair protein RadC